MEDIARMEEKKGKRVWVGYDKIRINDQWWRWDERGNRRQEKWVEREEEGMGG